MPKEADGTAAMNKAQVYKWHKRFHDDRSSVSEIRVERERVNFDKWRKHGTRAQYCGM
jgi:hypothetical protein